MDREKNEITIKFEVVIKKNVGNNCLKNYKKREVVIKKEMP
jgi:hypothetical protein